MKDFELLKEEMSYKDFKKLKNSKFNRTPATAKVEEYANTMAKGEWIFSQSPISIGWYNRCIGNGHSRQLAVIRAVEEKGAKIDKVVVQYFDDSTEEKEKNAVKALNYSSHFTNYQKIDTLIANGDSDFTFLKEFALDEFHPLLHSNGVPNYTKAAMLFTSPSKFKKAANGDIEFKLTNKDKKEAEQRYSEVSRLTKALKAPNRFQYIAEAWMSLKDDNYFQLKINEIGLENFYEKVTQNPFPVQDSKKKNVNYFYQYIS